MVTVGQSTVPGLRNSRHCRRELIWADFAPNGAAIYAPRPLSGKEDKIPAWRAPGLHRPVEKQTGRLKSAAPPFRMGFHTGMPFSRCCLRNSPEIGSVYPNPKRQRGMELLCRIPLTFRVGISRNLDRTR